MSPECFGRSANDLECLERKFNKYLQLHRKVFAMVGFASRVEEFKSAENGADDSRAVSSGSRRMQ
jgi:hypothetical protein